MPTIKRFREEPSSTLDLTGIVWIPDESFSAVFYDPEPFRLKSRSPFCNLDVAFMASALARIFFTTLLRGGWYRRGVVT
jgi:hypothetical protein